MRTEPCLRVLALIALTACANPNSMDPFDRITVKVTGGGSGGGLVVSRERTVNIGCRSRAGGVTAEDGLCQHTFADIGEGGRFDLIAFPDDSSRFDGWSGCTEVDGLVCTLVFPQGVGTMTFDVAARFISVSQAAIFGANLLQNPGFESRVIVGGLPTRGGGWEGDSAASVASTIAVPAHGGAQALRFITTGPFGASLAGVSSQQWQIVDLSSIAGAIDAGNVQATLQAWFYRIAGDETTDDRFDLRLTSYRGLPAEFPASYAAPGGVRFHDEKATVIAGAGVWTRGSLDVLIPSGVRYLVVEIYAFENRVNDATSPEFAGHYADDVSLVLRRLP